MDGDRGSSAPASDAAHLDASSSHQDKSSHKSDSKKAHKKDKAAAAAAAAATAAAASTTTTESTSEPVSPRRVSMSAPASEPSPRKERSPRTTDNAAPHDSSKSPRRSSAPSSAPEKSPRKEARVKSPRSSKDRGGKEAAGAELDAAATADGARHRSTGKAKKSRSKSLPHGELDSLDPRKDRNGNRKQPKTLDALLGTTEAVPSVSERKAQLKRVSSAGSSIQTTSSLAPLSHKAEQPASKSTSTDATLETTEQLAAATDGDDGGDGGGGSHSVSSEGAAAADEHHSLAKAADAADAPPLGDTTLNERPKRGKRSQKDRKAALMQSELQERQVKDVDTDTEDESSRPRSATTTCIDGVKYIDLSGNRPPDSAPTAFAIVPSSSNNSNPPATSATNKRTERLRARAPITKQESAPYKARKGSDGTGGPGGVTIPGKAKFFAILDKFGGTSSKKKPADITIKRSNSNSQLPTTSNELTRSLDASPNNFNSDLTTATTTTTATPGTASADSTVARVPSANSSQSMPTVAAASSPPTTSAIAAAAAAATTTPMGAQSTDSDLTSSSSTPGVSSPLTDSDALSPSPVVPEQADASPPKRTRPLSEREKVLSELLHTERDYVRDLSILIEVFFQPCKERSILSQQDLTTLFNNLEILYDLNGEILADLERRMASLGLGESEPLITVGDIFLRLAEYFKLYTHYCINLDNQNRVFHQAELNEQFAEFLKECKRNPRCRQLELPDFLIKPMQRLCKYPLILKELLTHTTEDHPDYDNLVAARPKVQDVVRYVNERKRVGENQQIIIDIQHSIEGCGRLLEASRRFIKQGQLFTYENKQRHRRQIFLFNDLILLAKPKSSSVFVSSAEGTEFQKYINVARVPMEHVRIVDVADAGEVKNGFELARKDTQEKFTILCDTPDMKREWIRNIKTIVKEYQKAEYIANKDRMLREAEAREVRRLAFRSLAQSSAEPTHDQNSDAWTLGLILWSMYTQRPLFEGFTPAQAAIALMTRQFHPEITPDIPDSLAEILQDCWLENRDARPNFSMVYDQIRLLDDVQWPATKPFNL